MGELGWELYAHTEYGAALWDTLWAAGALAQLWVTAWVLGRWWKGNGAGGLVWASATPALFIPIVGNVLVPLAGVKVLRLWPGVATGS